jgi:hypothetical protein
MGVARALKPWVHVYGAWRGGSVVAIDGDAITLRLLLGNTSVGTRVIDRALMPAGNVTLGMPVAARMDGDPLQVLEVRGTRWAGAGPGADEVGAVQRGDYHFGVITPDHDADVPWGFWE